MNSVNQNVDNSMGNFSKPPVLKELFRETLIARLAKGVLSNAQRGMEITGASKRFPSIKGVILKGLINQWAKQAQEINGLNEHETNRLYKLIADRKSTAGATV